MMKYCRNIFIAFLVWLAAGGAQLALAGGGMMPGPGTPHSSGGGGYTGPGDLGFGSATAFFGFRCYTATYAGNVADIFDVATGTTETLITCDGAGNLVTSSPTAIATTCATACSVKTLYDQTGSTNCTGANCNITQATLANRPVFNYLSASCGTNSKSCLSCPGTAGIILQSSNALSSTAQTFYYSTVLEYTGATSARQSINISGGPSNIQHGSTANNLNIASATVSGNFTAHDSQWMAIQATYAGASSSVLVNGSTTSLSTGVLAASATIRMCSFASGSAGMVGFIAEWGIWPSASTFTPATILSNQQGWYGGMTAP